MKDKVKEFELLQEKSEKIFELFGNLFKPASRNLNITHQKSQVTNNYLASIDNGTECAPGHSNNRVTSEPGSTALTFYSIKGGKLAPTGQVKNIKPLLDNAGISKKVLRCYDIDKDPLKIRWLFDGEYIADILDWDKKQKKVIFQGKWINGIKGGIMNPGDPEQKVISPLQEKFMVYFQGREIGPYTGMQIKAFYMKKTFTANTKVRQENSKDYVFLKDTKLFFLIAGKQPVQQAGKQAPVSPLMSKYFILNKSQETGPYTAQQIMGLYQKNKLNGNSIVRPETSTDYVHISEDKILSYLIKSLPTQYPINKNKTQPVAQKAKPAVNPASRLGVPARKKP